METRSGKRKLNQSDKKTPGPVPKASPKRKSAKKSPVIPPSDVAEKQSEAEVLIPDSDGKQEIQEPPAPEPLSYGRLVVLGYSNCFVNPNFERVPGQKKWVLNSDPNDKYELTRQLQPTGIRRIKERTIRAEDELHSHRSRSAVSSHSICVSSRNEPHSQLRTTRTTLIEYGPDANTDLFQVGRMPTTMNQFVVPGYWNAQEGMMSRYAFRIQCERAAPFRCHIFAAGFDENRSIFLGPHALKWESPKSDAMTTSGIRIKHPSMPFWAEVSAVHGELFSAEESYPRQRGKPIPQHDNMIVDGTLIHTGGILMMWQSPESMNQTATWAVDEYAEELIDQHIQCPVNLHTIDFRRRSDVEPIR
eukprot:TRINITY_DN3436_c0_g1_i2.p1 TRINITY_DN3436_c0_g1~~TRINITY_DN3436_c0_g1_i2.p1  ORF type:complete len:384 (-),score=58.26 TRINITY_DN3436_c0_g1_i2:902-1984(-)